MADAASPQPAEPVQPPEPPAAPAPPRAVSPTSSIVRALIRDVSALEEAWSRCLEADDVATARAQLLMRWQALLTSLAASASQREPSLIARGVDRLNVSLPLTDTDLDRIFRPDGPEGALQRLVIAHIVAVAHLVEAIRIIESPSITVTKLHAGGFRVEHFFDAGGIELLHRRSELVARLEDRLDAELTSHAAPSPGETWNLQLARALHLIDAGEHDSALPHLLVAVKEVLGFITPELLGSDLAAEDLLGECPSVAYLRAPLQRARQMVMTMAAGDASSVADAVVLAEGLAYGIRRLITSPPRREIEAAMDALRAGADDTSA